MKKYNNVEEIRKGFINDGWSNNTSFSEVTEEEAKSEGFTYMLYGNKSISKGHKYYKMLSTGNIYDEYGKIVFYNVPVINA